MDIEYEATFTNIDRGAIREKLRQVGATLVKPEFLQKRKVFHLPKGHEITNGWVRVRDEADKITMSLKVVDGNKIDDQKEVCLKVNDFSTACNFLKTIGCIEKSYQENKRELWILNNVKITIDEWPFLEPFVEVEGSSEPAVKSASEQLGFDWNQAKFCDVSTLYSEKYNLAEERINNHTPKIIFEMENPFEQK